MNSDSPRPNFVIGGSPKCGTSSMHDYLSQHPEVYMSQEVKEPGFFCPELPMNVLRRKTTEAEYLALFAKAGGAKRIGEATVWYMYSKTAAQRIAEWDPKAKAILMVRNPVDAAYSLHGQLLWSRTEDLFDFEEAIEAEDDRREGRRISPLCTAPQQLQYTEIFRYTPQIRRFFDALGRDQVKVIVFDDFTRNTAEVYRQTLEFLGLDANHQADFKVVNAMKPVAPGFGNFFAKRPRLRMMVHKVISRPMRRRLINLLPYVVKTVDRPSKVSPELRAKLVPRFKDDLEQLSELLGRDLTHWARIPDASQKVEAGASA